MDPINSSTSTTPITPTQPAPSGGFPKNTVILIVLLIVVTGALVYLAWPKPTTTTTNTTPSTPSAAVNPTPKAVVETVLSLSPNPVVVVSSGSASVNVDINTGTNVVTAVQLELTYDPTKIGSVDIKLPTSNPFFPNPITLLKRVDSTKGTVSFAFGIAPSAKGIQGMGTVANITFRPLAKTGATEIVVLPTTQVTAEGQIISVLKSSTGATINLGQ